MLDRPHLALTGSSTDKSEAITPLDYHPGLITEGVSVQEMHSSPHDNHTMQ